MESVRRLTRWTFKGSGQKLLSHMEGHGVNAKHWPGDVEEDGCGYGVLGNADKAWKETREKGFNWLYADGPYWMRRKGDSIRLSWNSHWFVTGNGPDRQVSNLEEKGIQLKPWRKKRGETVLVCPSAHMQHLLGYGNDAEKWCESTVQEIKKHTSRPVKVRWKWNPGASLEERVKNMEADFEQSWAVVTSGSTIGCEALAYGLPVFSVKRCAASALGLSDLSLIDTPREPDDDERHAWAHNLGARQFKSEELRSGQAWRVMSEDLEHLNG